MKYETTFEGKPIEILDCSVEQGRRTRAGVEGADYEFGKIPDSEYVTCTHKDAVYIMLKTDKTVQCTCEYFRKNPGMICEHLLALREIKEEDYEAAPADIVTLLGETEGWTVNDAGKFIPPSKCVTPEVVAELPPESVEVQAVEQPTEKPAPKTGAKKPLCVATCQYCEMVIKASTQEKADERCANHEKMCKKRPVDEPDVSKTETTAPPENKTPVQVTHDAPPEKEKPQPTPAAVAKEVKKTTANTKSVFDNIEELIEFGVGQIFGDTGTGKTALCRELAEQAANDGKKVVYWDSEGNMTRVQRAAMKAHKNITYVLDRDWHHIKNMLSQELSKGAPKLGKCDLFILDSIGVPVLGIYGTMKQNQKGEALQGMQGLLYQLTVWAEANDAVVVVTNQPVSEMNKTKAEAADRHPFGDKAMFFTKEILKIVVTERNEYKTVCNLVAWRSRSKGRGAQIGTITVSNKGTEIQFRGE